MSEFSFTEKHPWEQGFSTVFKERLVPILERREAERKKLWFRAKTAMGVTGGLGAVGLAHGLTYEGVAQDIAGGALAVAGPLGARFYYGERWRGGMSEEVLPVLCDFLGDMRHGEQGLEREELADAGLVPPKMSLHLEDPVTGTSNGVDWALTEVSLSKTETETVKTAPAKAAEEAEKTGKKGKKSEKPQIKPQESSGPKERTRRVSKTVFRGLFLRLALPGEPPEVRFVRKGAPADEPVVGKGAVKGLQPIAPGGEVFLAAYTPYAADQVGALDYLTEAMTEGLLQIAREETEGAILAASIHKGALYLALPREKPFIEMGSLGRSLTKIEDDLHRTLSDLDLPRRAIERLGLEQPQPEEGCA